MPSAQDSHAAAVRAEAQTRVVHQPALELDAAAAIPIAGRPAAAASVTEGGERLVALALEAHVDRHVREVVAELDGALPRLADRHDHAHDLLGRRADLTQPAAQHGGRPHRLPGHSSRAWIAPVVT
jgi:hypothetical protein